MNEFDFYTSLGCDAIIRCSRLVYCQDQPQIKPFWPLVLSIYDCVTVEIEPQQHQ